MIQTAQEVLECLQADAVFMSHVGSYKFTNGFTADAISVLASNQQIPGILETIGNEVVIELVPDTSSRMIIAGCSIREKRWTVYMIQHEEHNPGSLVAMADRLLDLAPGGSYNVIGGGPKSSQIDGMEQVVARIPAFSPLVDLDPDAAPPPPVSETDIDGNLRESKLAEGGNMTTGQSSAKNDLEADGGSL